MKILKKIITLFLTFSIVLSLSGRFSFLPRALYWNNDEMIEQAIKYSNITWLKELLSDCNNDKLLQYFEKALTSSTSNSRFSFADIFYKMGLSFGNYPIVAHTSKRLSYDETLYLLKLGADPNVKDSDSYSPLYYALENASGQWEASGYYLSKLLIEYGAEPYPEMFRNEYEGDPERNVGNGAYRQIAHSPMTARFLLGLLLESGQESGLPKAVEYAVLGKCEKSLNELKNGNTVSDVDMGLISYYFGYFGTMEQYQAFADFWGKYAKPPASCVAGAGNAEVLKRLYLDKDPNNADSKEFVLDFSSCGILISAMQMEQIDVMKLLLSYESINHQWTNEVWLRAFYGGYEGFCLLYDFWEANVDGGFKEELIEQFYPDRGMTSKDKYKKIDFLFDKGYDCRYVSFDYCNSDTINYLYKKGRPLMPDDLEWAAYDGSYDEIKAVIEKGIDVEYTFSFDIRSSRDIKIKYDNNTILYEYDGYSDVGKGFMTYEDLCNSTVANNGLSIYAKRHLPETLQYVIDQGLELPDDCLLNAYQYSAANVKVLLENGANTKIKADVIPAGSMRSGAIKRGEFTLKEYFEAYNRPDLVKLIDEYD
ncbi:MAG: hypothetical protein HDT21_06845 [Ruminococcus sp.]|nr:hypothetical protein [Ruminococcus sp.]